MRQAAQGLSVAYKMRLGRPDAVTCLYSSDARLVGMRDSVAIVHQVIEVVQICLRVGSRCLQAVDETEPEAAKVSAQGRPSGISDVKLSSFRETRLQTIASAQEWQRSRVPAPRSPPVQSSPRCHPSYRSDLTAELRTRVQRHQGVPASDLIRRRNQRPIPVIRLRLRACARDLR